MLQPNNLISPAAASVMTDSFGGLNRKTRISEGEFADLLNMTGTEAPLIKTRKRRTTVKTFESGMRVNGFASKGALCWTVDNGTETEVWINNRQVQGVSLTRADGDWKTIVGMGAYLCIFPDGYYINVVDQNDKGYMGRTTRVGATAAIPLRLTPCTFSGGELSTQNVGPNAPSNPTGGTIWADTSGDVTQYKIYDSGTAQWVAQSTVYVRFDYAGIDTDFKQWDGIQISGIDADNITVPDTVSERLAAQVNELNLAGALLQGVGEGYVIIAGILDKAVELTGEVVLERKVPQLDFVTECNNRLWGCRFGVVDGQVVNEIIACKQGDFRNWFSYPGISTDSYGLSVGCEGPFTGAITYLGVPTFFKENYILKIYGDVPATFTLQQTVCAGVGRGMGESLCTDGSAVFFRSATDFAAYSGSYPAAISAKLGDFVPDVVKAGVLGGRIFFYCEADGERRLLIFDTDQKAWYAESCDEVLAMVKDGHVLYLLQRDDDGVCRIDSADEHFDALLIDDGSVPEREGAVDFLAETGDLGFGDIRAKYMKKVIVRAKLGEDAVLRCDVSYDGGAWQEAFTMSAEGRAIQESHSFIPRRCLDLRLRFTGRGDVTLVTVSRTINMGSEKE